MLLNNQLKTTPQNIRLTCISKSLVNIIVCLKEKEYCKCIIFDVYDIWRKLVLVSGFELGYS